MLMREDFAGVWSLERQIIDRKLGQTGQFSGRAMFTPVEASVLEYHETGQMRFGDGPVMQGERRYRWQFGPDGVAVFFEGGAPFHDFRPDGVGEGSDHLCGDDLYKVVYDFAAWPRWQATWTVLGPRKDYTSVSVYGDRQGYAG